MRNPNADDFRVRSPSRAITAPATRLASLKMKCVMMRLVIMVLSGSDLLESTAFELQGRKNLP